MSSQNQLRIGHVCSVLRAEFPDVSISKLRFLEDQGLVRPERTPGGYRMYSEDDVQALRRILQMQRDEFLPLKVIREELSRRISGTAGREAHGSAPKSERVALNQPVQRFGRVELCALAKVPERFVDECETYDLVHPVRNTDGKLVYTADDAAVLDAAARIARLGVDARNLKQVRTAVSRQTSLLEQIAAPRLQARNADARATAVRQLESMTQAFADLMRATFVRDIREFTDGQLAQRNPTTTSTGRDGILVGG